MNEVTKEKPEHKSGRQNGALKTEKVFTNEENKFWNFIMIMLESHQRVNANQVMNKALNVNS